MSLLHKFPSDLTVYILAHWCEIESLATNDSATCNKAERQLLLSNYQSNGFALNNDLADYSDYTIKYSSDKLKIMQWTKLRQIKLSAFYLYISYCGVPEYPLTTNILFTSNTYAIKELSFYAILSDVGDIKAARKQNLLKTIRFVNSCHQLKTLRFYCKNYDNQLLVDLDHVILKQLERLKWGSSDNSYQQMSTISLLIAHCVSLIELYLTYAKNTTDYNSVDEKMLISLILNNKNLQEIHLICVSATDRLLDAIFRDCKSIKSLIIETKKTKKLIEKSQFTLGCIYKFLWSSPDPDSIFINIDGSSYLKFKVSKKVFHDLVQLSQAPVLKHRHFRDSLLYYEDEFVLCM
jgi:hypothetical protein